MKVKRRFWIFKPCTLIHEVQQNIFETSKIQTNRSFEILRSQNLFV